MRIPEHPPAPSKVDPRDLAFFTVHPERRYRARPPFPEELAHAKLMGLLRPLKPGQELIVLVSRIGGPIITQLFAGRLDKPGVFPDTDDDILGGFKPKTPKGVPA